MRLCAGHTCIECSKTREEGTTQPVRVGHRYIESTMNLTNINDNNSQDLLNHCYTSGVILNPLQGLSHLIFTADPGARYVTIILRL